MIELYELAGINPDIRFSPFCWRVRMALAHKGVDARMVPWHFGQAAKLPGAPANDRVPVLVDNGEVIADSTAIAFHLEEKYHHGPTLFGGPEGEAHARFIISWADSVLHAAIFPLVAHDVGRQVRPKAQAAYRATREKRLGMSLEQAHGGRVARLPALHAALAPLRRVLGTAPPTGGTYLGGDEPSYADYAVFGAFQWARCVGDFELLAGDDPVYAWRELMLDLFDGFARRARRAA